MSAESDRIFERRPYALILLIALSTAEAGTGAREVFIEHGQRNSESGSIAGSDAREALERNGPRLAPSSGEKSGASLHSAGSDFWIYDATTRLDYDYDGDGYYTRLELEFDADTWYSQSEVYARLFLSLAGGPWNEYATTEIFTIFGSSPTDDYYVDTDLVSGYPSGSYDILIELYDAYDGAFVADFGPADSSALFDLPLEDQDRDIRVAGPPLSHSHGGGGALGPVLLIALLAVTARRRTRLRNRTGRRCC